MIRAVIFHMNSTPTIVSNVEFFSMTNSDNDQEKWKNRKKPKHGNGRVQKNFKKIKM